MSLLAAGLLTPLKLEDDELLAAALGNDFTRNLSAAHEWASKLGAVATEEEHFVEFNFVASRAVDLFNTNQIALRDAVLFAAGADNCVCHGEGRES